MITIVALMAMAMGAVVIFIAFGPHDSEFCPECMAARQGFNS